MRLLRDLPEDESSSAANRLPLHSRDISPRMCLALLSKRGGAVFAQLTPCQLPFREFQGPRYDDN